jgi:hypothetical protein
VAKGLLQTRSGSTAIRHCGTAELWTHPPVQPSRAVPRVHTARCSLRRLKPIRKTTGRRCESVATVIAAGMGAPLSAAVGYAFTALSLIAAFSSLSPSSLRHTSVRSCAGTPAAVRRGIPSRKRSAARWRWLRVPTSLPPAQLEQPRSVAVLERHRNLLRNQRNAAQRNATTQGLATTYNFGIAYATS